MKTLVINTYGGSLLLGAKAIGLDIVGSYEDAGFGCAIQKANFPEVPDFRERRADWPSRDLTDHIVIAHPPCSAFSVQNSNWDARGPDSKAFECTRTVLRYAMANNALVICIESVVGALNGAWNVHQQFADERGYHLYRILQNGSMFSAQWRERFWVVFVRKGAVQDPTFLMHLKPEWRTVRDVITGYEDGPSPGNLDLLLDRLKKRLKEDAGLSDVDLAYLFEPQDPPHPSTGISKVLRDKFFPEDELQDVCRDYVGGFASAQLCFVNPDGLAGVLLGGTWWYCNGRNMSAKAYKRLMGFPHDYIFPNRTNHNMRTYLSKGVIPQVASWILTNVMVHLGEFKHDETAPYRIAVQPNQIADFRIKRAHWGQAIPKLREDDV